MNWIEALILGLIQGLTEFLPVSSSGHLELGNILLGIESTENLTFAVVVHGATVLSIIVVLWKDVAGLFQGFSLRKWNETDQYLLKIFISMIPVLILGVFFKEEIEQFFTGNALLVGAMLLITALLLTLTHFVKSKNKRISYLDSLIIGIAQALAVMPGISRSGATIATGLLLKNQKEQVARFSFIMVLIPIIGANLLDIIQGKVGANAEIATLPLVTGFLAAFISGTLACRWMLMIVKRGKLVYFAIYCLLVGSLAILLSI